MTPLQRLRVQKIRASLKKQAEAIERLLKGLPDESAPQAMSEEIDCEELYDLWQSAEAAAQTQAGIAAAALSALSILEQQAMDLQMLYQQHCTV